MRITIEEAEKDVTMKIEGKVADAFVGELDRTWNHLAPALGSKKLSVDLRGVTFIDRSGRLLLAQIYAQSGANFLADSPMTKYFAEEAIRSLGSKSK